MEKLWKKGVCIFLIFSICIGVACSSQAKAKYKAGKYYNAKTKITLWIGSRWDKGNKVTVYTPRPGDSAHLDAYEFRYKNGKLVSDFAVITFKKNKATWKNKKNTKRYHGTYTFKKKEIL